MAKYGPKPIPMMDRFMAKVSPEPTTGCWLWEASTRAGKWKYGQLWDIAKQKPISTHRLSYELFIGPIPADKIVLHACDMPECVNPRHLKLGTHRDNTQDMFAKGRANLSQRGAKGERNSHAKLTTEAVAEIRRQLQGAPYGTKARLAVRYGVHPTAISRIAKNKIWKVPSHG